MGKARRSESQSRVEHSGNTCQFCLFKYPNVAAGTIIAGELLLEYHGAASASLILVIETAATISIAATLLVLFVGRAENSEPEGEGS